MTNKVAIIGTVGLPAKYGGFETLTEYLVTHLAQKRQLTVFCSAKAYTQQPATYKGAHLRYIPLNANGAQSIIYDIWSMLKALSVADSFLILGVSGCIFLPVLRCFTSKRLVVNIDGLEWKRNKWRGVAKTFLKFSERMAVTYGHEIVADNQAIKTYVHTQYGKAAHCIAYGGDHCVPHTISSALLAKWPFLAEPYAFKVCRIEPENNIELILKAFAKLSLNLVLVGNWAHSAYSRAMKTTYGGLPHIYLLDPIYNQETLNAIRSKAYVYVHGHSAGGTNPSLVEAMYLGLPIVAFDVNYNRATTHNKAFYFTSVKTLQDTIFQSTAATLGAQAADMKSLAMTHYKWADIAQQYSELL